MVLIELRKSFSSMQVDILTSNTDHPGLVDIKKSLQFDTFRTQLSVAITDDVTRLRGKGILFLVSYQRKLNLFEYPEYDHVIVFHASDLPKGRGWSPYVWDILQGAQMITVCAIDAGEEIDSGDIWSKATFNVAKTDLLKDVLERISSVQLELMLEVISMIRSGEGPVPQDPHTDATYYPKRTPEDSYLDPDKTLNQLFDQIRMSDPHRFPAILDIHGAKFKIIMERIND